MRILQVVAYISPDGAYGGPVRVAINQAKALADLGHEVVVVAAAGGFNGPMPKKFDGISVKLFPARRVLPRAGFAGIISPGLLAWLARAIENADVVHIHLARDLLTLPAAVLMMLSKKPLVVQTHGMIDHTDKISAKPLDWLMTRPVMRYAGAVLYLTESERSDLQDVAGKLIRLKNVSNGIPVPHEQAIEQREGAQDNLEVIFLARLHAHKRPMLIVHAARELADKYPRAQFTLVGPDEGEAEKIQDAIRKGLDTATNLQWSGPLPPDQTIERMRRACIYALPSKAESFGMSIAEAMSIGLPVVITESCGIAPIVRQNNAGIVCDQTQGAFTQAIDRLLGDSDLRVTMGANAREAAQHLHSTQDVADELAAIYTEICATNGTPK